MRRFIGVSHRRREVAAAVLTAFGVVALAGTLTGPGAGADTTGTPDPVVKASVTGGQTNVAPSGPLTGITAGTTVHVHVDAGSGSSIFELKARLCKPGVDITSTSKFSPTQLGNCIAAPFVTNTDDDFVDVPTDSPFTSGNLDFRVGAGSQTFTASSGSTTIVCGVDKPCALWIFVSVPTTVQSSGGVYKHFDINYAGSSPTSSTTSTTVGATSTTATTATTQATTSTTTLSSSTTSTTGDGSSTTSTSTTVVAGAITVTPATVEPGGTVAVSSADWRPGSDVTAVLHSDPVTLGTLTADASGTVTGNLTIPATTELGSHTLELSGTAPDSTARTVSTSLTVGDPSTSTTSATSSTSSTGSSSSDTSTVAALARTGLQVLRLVVIAGLLFGAGVFLVSSSRRRHGSGRT